MKYNQIRYRFLNTGSVTTQNENFVPYYEG